MNQWGIDCDGSGGKCGAACGGNVMGMTVNEHGGCRCLFKIRTASITVLFVVIVTVAMGFASWTSADRPAYNARWPLWLHALVCGGRYV
jgi:hypothetical protein